MSYTSAAAPAILTLGLLLAVFAPIRLHPATKSRVISVLIVATGAASAAWASVVAGAFLVDSLPFAWSEAPLLRLLAGHRADGPLEFVAIVLLVAAAVRWFSVIRREPRVVEQSSDGFVVIDDRRLFAYAVSGRDPHIAVSRELVDTLTPAEFGAVISHERSHLVNRHHRFVLTARRATAFAIWLVPMISALRYQLERWSDEDAAEECGDRELLAMTIAKVALSDHDRRSALAIGNHHVRRRVEALLAQPPGRMTIIDSATTISANAAATGMVGSALQLHHLLPHIA
jgi:Zn-dependent protease with chaperone function